jgi:hypothetical protein
MILIINLEVNLEINYHLFLKKEINSNENYIYYSYFNFIVSLLFFEDYFSFSSIPFFESKSRMVILLKL